MFCIGLSSKIRPESYERFGARTVDSFGALEEAGELEYEKKFSIVSKYVDWFSECILSFEE